MDSLDRRDLGTTAPHINWSDFILVAQFSSNGIQSILGTEHSRLPTDVRRLARFANLQWTRSLIRANGSRFATLWCTHRSLSQRRAILWCSHFAALWCTKRLANGSRFVVLRWTKRLANWSSFATLPWRRRRWSYRGRIWNTSSYRRRAFCVRINRRRAWWCGTGGSRRIWAKTEHTLREVFGLLLPGMCLLSFCDMQQPIRPSIAAAERGGRSASKTSNTYGNYDANPPPRPI